MSSNFDQFDLLEDLDEIHGHRPRVKNKPNNKKRPRRKDLYNKISEPEVAYAIFLQRDDLQVQDFSYKASKTERVWLIESLGQFFDQRWFDDVLQIVKGGKEASVYQLLGNDTTKADFIAGKVYRPRMFRNLRNDHIYREGRPNLDADGLEIRKERELKAIRQKTRFGQSLTHTSWIEHEARTMRALDEAGCDVPKYYASSDNAILMEYIGGPEMAAPTLNTVKLPLDEANELFRRVMHNIELMLAHDRIHGDLSAFNILYWQGEITLIDFPQAISPTGNRNAYRIFERDVTRVCEYFIRQGVSANPNKLARDMWRARKFRFAPEADPEHLDPENEEDMAYWEKYG